MSAFQGSHSRKKQLLKKEIEYKQKSLQAYKKYIDRKDDEIIRVLEAKKLKKEDELKACYGLQYWAKSNISNEILKLQSRINELKSLEEQERDLEELTQQLRDIPGHGEREYPGSLDDKLVSELRQKFTTLPSRLTPKVPFMNIIMIGVTGSGKSSFLRTFTTALGNRDIIKDIYRACPLKGREESATKEPIYMRDNEERVPCRFFDMPGVDENDIIKKAKLNKILNGEIKLNYEMHQERRMALKIQNPNPADAVHCILYVLKATTNLDEMPTGMISMIELLKDKNAEDGVRQFVVVTSIDEIGVPNDDMKNAYKYPCVHEYCKKVSEAFGVDLLHVIPVSNYFDEVAPNDAKNAMSLHSLWRVFESTREYIDRRWLKEETIMISQDWACKKNSF